MLEAIYSSKMYRSSRHKDKIKSAIDNPINSELVKQLSSYLDVPEKEDKKEVEVNQDVKDTRPEEAKDRPEHEASNNLSSPRPAERVNDKHSEETEEAKETVEDGETSEETKETVEDDKSDVGESVQISGQRIQACETVDIVKDISIVKDALNTREDTQGVIRTNVDNNELWIYFDDKKNLNDIMTNVIDYFIAAGYSYLEFNRLARSDNAMVFVIKQ